MHIPLYDQNTFHAHVNWAWKSLWPGACLLCFSDEDFEDPECQLQVIHEGEEKDYCGSDILGDSSTSSETDYPDDEEEDDIDTSDMYKWPVNTSVSYWYIWHI